MDHRPLVYAPDQRSDKASPRQARHLEYILRFNAEFRHVRGEDNVVADAISRICTVDMPIILDANSISQAQLNDEELLHLIYLLHLKSAATLP